ncbi:MAG: hypothetical protein NTY76_01950 [Candidatus Omnitrophica bacterium]|nr:hypothetical protein [Candidatus Omnitrophota bacterium]
MIDARSNTYMGTLLHNKPFKVIACLITLTAFFVNLFFYDLALLRPLGFVGRAWADSASAELISQSIIKELDPKTFALPQSLGTIKDAWTVALSAFRREHPSPIVIQIQDAHCNYNAQKKIAEIIKYINDNYGIRAINLEGGAKGYDLSVFTSIADKEVREKTSDYFVKDGLVNGAEYFAVNNPEKVTLWGIEDPALYVDNLNVYRNSFAHKDEAEVFLKSLSCILTNLKIKIYSKELLEFDTKYSQYKADNLGFKEYLAYLLSEAKAKAIDIKPYHNIFLLNQAQQEESAIDFNKANNERDQLIDMLHKKLSKNAMEELVVKTVEFKAERISQKDFYAYLMDRAKKSGINLQDLPEFTKYIVYIALYDAMDKMKVMDEIDILETKIKDAFFENETQRDLARLSKNFAIMKNIFNISLTRDDYRYYEANEGDFRLSNYERFIDANAPKYKITATLNGNINDIDRYREEISKFYEYSFKRDSAFVKNLKFAADGRAPQTASILVTGGFHTDNLCEIFRKEGISYISIIPNFKNDEGYKSPYFKLLSGKQDIMDPRLATLFNSSLAIASILNELGIKVEGDDFERHLRIMIALKAKILEMNISNQGLVVVFNGDNRLVIDGELNVVNSSEAGLPRIDVNSIINELPVLTTPVATAPALSAPHTTQPTALPSLRTYLENMQKDMRENMPKDMPKCISNNAEIEKAIGISQGNLRGGNKVAKILLEIGCGSGKTASAIAKKNGDMGIIATDIYDPKSRAPKYKDYANMFARGKLPLDELGNPLNKPLDNLSVVRASSEILNSLQDNSIDYILLVNPQPEAVEDLFTLLRDPNILKKLKRGAEVVIKPTGVFGSLRNKIEGSSEKAGKKLKFIPIREKYLNTDIPLPTDFYIAGNNELFIWKNEPTLARNYPPGIYRTEVTVIEGKVTYAFYNEKGDIVGDTHTLFEGQSIAVTAKIGGGAILVESSARTTTAYAPGTYRTEVTVTEGVVSIVTYNENNVIVGDKILLFPGNSASIMGGIKEPVSASVTLETKQALRDTILRVSKLESMLRDADSWAARNVAMESLSAIYPMLYREGKIALEKLELMLRDSDSDIRQVAAKALGAIYPELYRKREMTLERLKLMLAETNWAARLAAGVSLGAICPDLESNDQQGILEKLESMIRSDTSIVRQAVSESLGAAYPVLYKRKESKDISLSKIILMLKDGNNWIVNLAVISLGAIYLNLDDPNDRQTVFENLEPMLENNNYVIQQAAAKSLSAIYPNLDPMEKKRVLEKFEYMLKHDRFTANLIAGLSIGTIYPNLDAVDQNRILDIFKSMLRNTDVSRTVAESLILIYPEIYKENKITLGELESMLGEADGWASQMAAAVSLIAVRPDLDPAEEGRIFSILESMLTPANPDDCRRAAVSCISPIYANQVTGFLNSHAETLHKYPGDDLVSIYLKLQFDLLKLTEKNTPLIKEFDNLKALFTEKNKTLEESRRIDEAKFWEESTATVVMLADIMGKDAFAFLRGLLGVKDPFRLNRFFEAVKLYDTNTIKALEALYSSSDKKDPGSFQKILEIAMAYIDLKNTDAFISILNASAKNKAPLSRTYNTLAERYIKDLAKSLDIDASSVKPEVFAQFYMPFIGRLKVAMDFIIELDRKTGSFDKTRLFKSLLKATFNDTFNTFITDITDNNEEGKDLALHNEKVREAIRKSGINPDKWLNYSYEEGFSFSDRNLEVDPESYIMGTAHLIIKLYDCLPSGKKESFRNFIDNDLQLKISDDKNAKIRLVPANKETAPIRNKRLELIRIFSEKDSKKNPVNIDKLLDSKTIGFFERNLKDNVEVQEAIGHLRSSLLELRKLITDAEEVMDRAKKSRHFTIKMWNRSPAHDLFLGDFTGCCMATNSRTHFEAMIDHLIDQGIQVAEVIDQDTNKTMALAWLFLAKDSEKPYLVIDNMEISDDYSIIEPLKAKIKKSLIDYTIGYARNIGVKTVLAGPFGYSKFNLVQRGKDGVGDYIREDEFSLDKIGGYYNETKYYLEALVGGSFEGHVIAENITAVTPAAPAIAAPTTTITDPIIAKGYLDKIEYLKKSSDPKLAADYARAKTETERKWQKNPGWFAEELREAIGGRKLDGGESIFFQVDPERKSEGTCWTLEDAVLNLIKEKGVERIELVSDTGVIVPGTPISFLANRFDLNSEYSPERLEIIGAALRNAGVKVGLHHRVLQEQGKVDKESVARELMVLEALNPEAGYLLLHVSAAQTTQALEKKGRSIDQVVDAVVQIAEKNKQLAAIGKNRIAANIENYELSDEEKFDDGNQPLSPLDAKNFVEALKYIYEGASKRLESKGYTVPEIQENLLLNATVDLSHLEICGNDAFVELLKFYRGLEDLNIPVRATKLHAANLLGKGILKKITDTFSSADAHLSVSDELGIIDMEACTALIKALTLKEEDLPTIIVEQKYHSASADFDKVDYKSKVIDTGNFEAVRVEGAKLISENAGLENAIKDMVDENQKAAYQFYVGYYAAKYAGDVVALQAKLNAQLRKMQMVKSLALEGVDYSKAEGVIRELVQEFRAVESPMLQRSAMITPPGIVTTPAAALSETERTAIMDMLAERNWYYPKLSENDKKLFNDKVLGGLKEGFQDIIKDMIVEYLKANKKLMVKDKEIDKSLIKGIYIYGSWCYAPPGRSPTDIDVIVVVEGINENPPMETITITDPDRWFVDRKRSVEKCDVKILSAEEMFSGAPKDEVQLVEEANLGGHAIPTDGMDSIKILQSLKPPSKETLLMAVEDLLLAAELYTIAIDASDKDNIVGAPNLIKSWSRWDEAFNVLSYLMANYELVDSEKRVIQELLSEGPGIQDAIKENNMGMISDKLKGFRATLDAQLTLWTAIFNNNSVPIVGKVEAPVTSVSPDREAYLGDLSGKADALKALIEPQIEAAKAVIADISKGTADIIIMPGSDIYLPKQTAVNHDTVRKLHKDYGQDTVPYSYKFGDDWMENLKKQVLPKAMSELQDRIGRGDNTARAIIFAPSEREGVAVVKEVVKNTYPQLTDLVSVVGEENIPDSGIIDNVMHIVLGKGLLNYGRYGKDMTPDSKRLLVDLIKSLVSNPGAIDLVNDPNIVNNILNGLFPLRIKPIDFKEIEEWKEMQDAVLTAL